MISRTVNSILLFSILYTLNKTLATEILMVFIISGLALYKWKYKEWYEKN